MSPPYPALGRLSECMTRNDDTGQSRRNFLRSAAVGGLATGAFTAVSFAQDEADQPATTFVLNGEVEAWQGVAPQEISGASNPTLRLTPGETYRVVWQNFDGQPHNFAVLDADGNPLEVLQPLQVDAQEISDVFNNTTNVSDVNVTGAVNATNATGNVTGNATDGGAGLVAVSEIITQQGAVQALDFEASEEMAQYYCQVHPNTMRGDVEIQQGGGNATNNSS